MGTLILRETHKALIEEMDRLEKQKKQTSIKIREAASHGDLKENGEYHAAREEQSMIIYKKQLMQSHSPFEIVENGQITTDIVGFGNKVAILEEKISSSDLLLMKIDSAIDKLIEANSNVIPPIPANKSNSLPFSSKGGAFSPLTIV